VKLRIEILSVWNLLCFVLFRLLGYLVIIILIIITKAVVIIQLCREHDGLTDFLCGMCSTFIYSRVRNVGC